MTENKLAIDHERVRLLSEENMALRGLLESWRDSYYNIKKENRNYYNAIKLLLKENFPELRKQIVEHYAQKPKGFWD